MDKIEPCPVCGSEGVLVVYAPKLCRCSTECPMQSLPINIWNRLGATQRVLRVLTVAARFERTYGTTTATLDDALRAAEEVLGG